MLLQALTEVLFHFRDSRIDESSGLVEASSAEAWYTVNDSNDELRYYVVDGAGRTLAVHEFPGVDCRDLEDAAAGPDRTLYLGDIGDNDAVRPRVLVHRVPEPAVDPAARGAVVRDAAPQTASLTYDDGAHDAETLLVHPRTGQLLVVTKGLLGSGVYEAPQPFADGVLRRVATVGVRATGTEGGPGIGAVAQVLVTGGAVSPDGRRVVLRTYTDAYVYEVPGDDLVAALRTRPTVLPLPVSRQGEAITWTRDGSALVTSSEGRGSAVEQVTAPPAPAPSARPSGPPAPSAAPSARAAQPAAERDGTPTRALVLAGAIVLFVTLLGAAARRRSTR